MHRTRNMLAIIQSVVRNSASAAMPAAEIQDRILSRLYAMSRVHDLLVATSYVRCSLRDLFAAICRDEAGRADARVSFAGEDVDLNPDAAQALGMALHELYAGSKRGGALSRPRGAVALIVARAGAADDEIVLDWRERGCADNWLADDRLGKFIVTANLPRMFSGSFTDYVEEEDLVYEISLSFDGISPLKPSIAPASGEAAAASSS